MREMTKSDVALLNSGTFRADRLFYQGNLTLGDLNTILPMMDRVVQLKMPGSILKLALENGVSKYPTTSGRFLQVSGRDQLTSISGSSPKRTVLAQCGWSYLMRGLKWTELKWPSILVDMIVHFRHVLGR